MQENSTESTGLLQNRNAQRSAGLPLRAVKPLGGVLVLKQLLEVIPVALKTRSFGQMQK